jgi:hypothetical protein
MTLTELLSASEALAGQRAARVKKARDELNKARQKSAKAAERYAADRQAADDAVRAASLRLKSET